MIDQLTTSGRREKQSRAVDGLFCAALDHLHLKDRESPRRTAGVVASAATSYRSIAAHCASIPLSKENAKNRKSDAKRCIMMHDLWDSFPTCATCGGVSITPMNAML